MPLLCVGHSVKKCHRHVQIINMSDEQTDQSIRTASFLLILMRCVLALASWAWYCHWFSHKKGKTTDLNTSSIKCYSVPPDLLSWVLNISRWTWRKLMHETPCLQIKLNFWGKSTLTLIYLAALGATDPDKASIKNEHIIL